MSEGSQVHGHQVLRSKTAWTLLWFWVFLGLVLLIPSPVRDHLRNTGAGRSGPTGIADPKPGAPSLPGLPPTRATPVAGPVDPKEKKAERVEAIQDPKRSMVHFYRSLARTAARKKRGDRDRAITRVLHYGDSLIDLDHITGPLRRMLQRRYGDGGHGFVLAAKPWRWYNHAGLSHVASSSWTHYNLMGKGGAKRSAHLGLGCAAVQSAAGRSWVLLKTSDKLRSTRLEVHYLKMRGGGKILVNVNGKPLATIKTAADSKASGRHLLTVPDEPHRIRLTTYGRVRLFGIVLEREGPGITWENLTLVSARFHQLLSIDTIHWAEQLKLRRPDLVVFQFGANDTISYGGDLERYGRQIKEVMTRMRQALPRSSCMVIGPLDRLQRDAKGRLSTPKNVRIVSDKQRQMALAAGCAFWDGQRAMGGPGSMRRWLERRLALKDMVHLNVRGSKIMAGLLERALLDGYRRHKPGKKKSVLSRPD